MSRSMSVKEIMVDLLSTVILDPHDYDSQQQFSQAVSDEIVRKLSDEYHVFWPFTFTPVLSFHSGTIHIDDVLIEPRPSIFQVGRF